MKLTLVFLSLILAACQPVITAIIPDTSNYENVLVGKWATTQKVEGYKCWDVHIEFRADGTKIGNWTICDEKGNPQPYSYKAHWSIRKAKLYTTIFEASPELLEREKITLPYAEKSHIRSLTADEFVITFTRESLTLQPREWLVYKRED